MKISLPETIDTLLRAKKIVLTAHVNPDGDAIGSTLGLMHFLHNLGKETLVLIDDDIPATFKVLPGYECLQRPEEGKKIAADLLVALDVSLDRIGIVGDVVAAPTLNIDHHPTNDEKADNLYLDGSRAATAEIIYQLIEKANGNFTKEIAMCLYTGIATDTGWFRFSNTTSLTMQIAANLIDSGAEPNVISEALEEKPFERIKALAEAMNKIELFANGKIGAVFLDYSTINRLEHTDGLINFIRVIEGVKIALVLKEKEPDLCRVSMRSKGIDVAKVAIAFNGGGHVRAAGCTIKLPFAEAKKAILKAVTAAVEEQN